MTTYDLPLHDRIAKICLEAYELLSKRGKPVENEWTVLACVVLYDDFNEDLEVVSLGTGSKCIGASFMSPNGFILHDSHAEVIARRGFLLYLYDNMRRTAGGETTIFRLENGKFTLDNNVEFYFYTSHLPCGDACIIPKVTRDKDYVGRLLETGKRQASHLTGEDDDDDVKKQKLDDTNDDRDYIHKTGAKCLPQSEQDESTVWRSLQLPGQVRTKPGRGDRTLSMSCSDKMARWIYTGIQGALLDMLLYEPIYIKLFVIGAGVPYSQEAVERALLTRNFKKPPIELKCKPKIVQTKLVFPNIQVASSVRLAPASILWVKQEKEPLFEVITRGYPQGVVKKTLNQAVNAPYISKYNLYKKFLSVLKKLDKEVVDNAIGDDYTLPFVSIPYNEMKIKSKRYLKNWDNTKTNFFGSWTKKPDMFRFCVDLKET